MPTHAQTSFQGRIEYEVRVPGESVPAKLILSFGATKIKMEFIVPGKTSDNDYSIIDMDSGKMYNMNVRDKSYETKALQKNVTAPLPQGKEFAGHRTTPILQRPVTTNPDDEFLKSLNSGVFYIADDLYYAVPDAYVGNPALLMVKNGRIVLGAEIELSGLPLGMAITGANLEKSKAIVTATSIVPMKQDAGVLAVPPGFEDKSAKTLVNDAASQIKDSVDSSGKFTDVKNSKHKPSKPGQKRSSTPKTSSIHNKKD